MGRRQWTSPLTNATHFGSALLTPDFLRAGACREFHQRAVRLLEDPWDRFLCTARARFGLHALCTASDCAELTGHSVVLARVRAESPLWSTALLEVCWRAGRLDAYPADLVVALCDKEQRSDGGAFVQREVWGALLALSALRYLDAPCDSLSEILIRCRAHYMWRLEQVDAVHVPSTRAPNGTPLLLLRASYVSEAENANCLWADHANGFKLRVPSLTDDTACLTECLHSVITSKSGAESHYRSRVAVGLSGPRLWIRRRLPHSVASFVARSNRGRDDASISTTASSPTSDTETDPDPEPNAALGGVNSARCWLDTLSILEKPALHLPEGFEYVSRVKDEDAAPDEEGALAHANEAIVTGVLNKRQRAGGGSGRRSKSRRTL